MAADSNGLPDDTVIHWLIGLLAGLSALVTSILAWSGKDAMERLKKVEDNKADKGEIAARFDEMAENQRQIMQRFDQAHQDNTRRLDNIVIALTSRKDK